MQDNEKEGEQQKGNMKEALDAEIEDERGRKDTREEIEAKAK